MPDFSTQLRACQTRADMTVSDLALWFARPRATVNTWVNGRSPAGPSGRRAWERLQLLQQTLRNRSGLPVPDTLSWRERIKHIEGVRNAAFRDGGLSKMRAAG